MSRNELHVSDEELLEDEDENEVRRKFEEAARVLDEKRRLLKKNKRSNKGHRGDPNGAAAFENENPEDLRRSHGTCLGLV